VRGSESIGSYRSLEAVEAEIASVREQIHYPHTLTDRRRVNHHHPLSSQLTEPGAAHYSCIMKKYKCCNRISFFLLA